MPALAAIMTRAWQRIKGSRTPDYERLPLSEKEPVSPTKSRNKQGPSRLKYLVVAFAVSATLLGSYGLVR
jgi:hypothetical protein